MADEDYARLAPACGCGAPVKEWLARGRRTTRCEGCAPRLAPKPAIATVERVCVFPGCGSVFTCTVGSRKKCCGDKCRSRLFNGAAAAARRVDCVGCKKPFATEKRTKRTWCSLECKPKALRGLFSCMRCGAECKNKKSGGKQRRFCSKACSGANRTDGAAPKFCAYYASHCKGCGKAHGQRLEWGRCPSCHRTARLSAAKEASRATAKAKHKAVGKVVACDECSGQFCPLYGKKTGSVVLCGVCGPIRRAKQKREQSGGNATRAKKRGAPRKHFNEVKHVLERDGWCCQICGISTPKSLRGTFDPRAPEVDHVIPLSALGTPGHVPENCQCACRACNIAKGAKPLGQLALSL